MGALLLFSFPVFALNCPADHIDEQVRVVSVSDGDTLRLSDDRRVRIVGKQDIEVSVRNLQVSVNGDEATAKFRQHYVAGALNTTTRKTLQLRHEKGQWHIVRESTGG